MRKSNPTRYSSAVGELWVHASFKIKYCYKVFDIYEIKNAAKALFIRACVKYEIVWKSLGFDSNHVHSMLDIGNYNRPQVAKLLKGFITKKLFKLFPWLKQKYFKVSGLWSPAYYMESIQRYIRRNRGIQLKMWFR